MDVQKYLQRIEYTGSRVANLDNLNQLCWCHATHVPQYTLDLFGGEGKQFDLENIYHKIVQLGLGGFCYELNGLFGNLLKLLGYKIELLQGSCFMQSSDEFNFPFDHLLLKVTINEEIWIVDVGYGAPSFFMPKLLVSMESQKEMSGIYRLRREEDAHDSYFVEKRHKQSFHMDTGEKITANKRKISKYSISEDWDIIFKFSTTPHEWEEFRVGWNSHLGNPNGFLMTNSFLELFTHSGLKILWGGKLMEKEFPDPLTEKIRCTDLLVHEDGSDQDIYSAIKEHFGITLDFKPKFCSKNFRMLVR